VFLFAAAPAHHAIAADSKPALGLKPVAEGFVSPLNIVWLPDNSGRYLVADQIGTIQLFNKDGQAAEPLFLDLRSKLVKLTEGFDERGLLGLALHPKFNENHKLYVFYSAPPRSTAP